MNSGVFIQVGATRDRLDPYLSAARVRGIGALLVETPDYINYRSNLNPVQFDKVIAIDDPENPAALLNELQQVPGLRLVLPGFERYVNSSFAVARSLELAAPPISLPTDKYSQRLALAKATSICQPSFLAIDLDSDPREIDLERLRMPLVVKPVDGGGGLGVFLVQSLQELQHACNRLRELRNYGGSEFSRLILEEYVPGTEVSIQGIARSNCADILSICEKQIGQEQDNTTQTIGFREIGHVVRNYEYSSTYTSLANRCLSAFGYSDGPFHIDAIEGADGRISFLEMGYRLSGARIVELIHRATGIQMADEVFASLLNENKQPTEANRKVTFGQCLVASPSTLRLAKSIKHPTLSIEVTEFSQQPQVNLKSVPSLVPDLQRHSGFAGMVRIGGLDWREVQVAICKLAADDQR
jgi:carbamoylphosphate synthase large subunit